MEILTELLLKNINPTLFTLIILSGLFITKYTKHITAIANVYKVLIASIIIAIVLYVIEDCNTTCLKKFITTYLLATSFYEIIVRWFKSKIKDKFSFKKQA